MRILLLTRPICPPWDEGSKNFAFELAKKMNGHELHVLTCANVPELPRSVVQHPIYTSPKLNLAQKFRLFKFLRKAKGFDVVHSLFTPTKTNSFFTKFALQSSMPKFIQTVATLREDFYDAKDFKKILFGDLIVAYSDYAKEKLESMGFANVKRIYPAIDTNHYAPAPKNAELAERLNTSADDFVINYTGEYVRLGDMDDIVAVFLELARKHDNFKLHLALRVKNEKDAQKKAEVQAEFKRLGILERVATIEGIPGGMEDVYNLADISIFPARTMAGKFDIPLAVIEAMSCGKPLIASDLPRLRYFLSNENSILIKPGDRGALKEKILYLYENKEERDKLGKAGREFARENFDIMKVVKEYEEVYRNL